MIAKYRKEIRCDLQEIYGVDLAVWYKAGRWAALLDYIDGLPSACRLNEARVQDPETARQLAEAQLDNPSDEPWSPRVADFDLTAVMLREALGKLDGIQQAIIAGAGGTPKRGKPFPGPRTAVDAAKATLEHEFVEDIVGMFGFNPETDL